MNYLKKSGLVGNLSGFLWNKTCLEEATDIAYLLSTKVGNFSGFLSNEIWNLLKKAKIPKKSAKSVAVTR